MALHFTPEKEAALRAETRKAKPYRPGEAYDTYFDEIDERQEATLSMRLLKCAGLWTEEDEQAVFGE